MGKLAQNRSFKFMGGIEDGKSAEFLNTGTWVLPAYLSYKTHAAGRCRKTGGIYGGLQKEKRLIGDPQILCEMSC